MTTTEPKPTMVAETITQAKANPEAKPAILGTKPVVAKTIVVKKPIVEVRPRVEAMPQSFVQPKPSPHRFPWCNICVSKNSEHETTKEWVTRELKELEDREKRALVMVCNTMGRIYHEGHGTIRWDQEKKMFSVNLERLWKERINRRELMKMLRFCVELMMALIPTFRGVKVDLMREQKYMLFGGRFTQRRVKNGMIEWFKNELPNGCFIRFIEKCRDTGIDTQAKYKPAELVNLHCMGGNEHPKFEPLCRPISF